MFPDDPPVPAVSVEKGDKEWSVSSGDLTAVITENPYTITFKSPTRTLTSAGAKHQAIYDVPNKWTLRSASNNSCLATDFSSNPTSGNPPELVRYVHSELNLSPGELIYGLGEQFGAFVKNGEPSRITLLIQYVQTTHKANQLASGTKTVGPQANKPTNASHFILRIETMGSLSTIPVRSRWKLVVKKSVESELVLLEKAWNISSSTERSL